MSRPIIVISQPWGGLGDNLQFSTLPQLFTEKGYDVYISSRNAIRNQEIYDIVWGKNPYIKGISSLPSNAGSCKAFNIVTSNPMKNMELAHGLTEGCAEYPIIHYKPNYIPDLSNCLIFDYTSISSSYTDTTIQKYFTAVFDKYPHLTKKKVVFNTIANRSISGIDTDSIRISNIYEYCDVIYSCNVFLSTFSGQSVLASAIKGKNPTPTIYTIHSHLSITQKEGFMFAFNNINYVYITP